MKAKKKSLLQRTGNSLFYCSGMERDVNSWNFPEMLWKWTWSKVSSPSSGWYKGLKISYKLELLQKYVDSISKVNQRLCNKGPAEGFKWIYQAEGHSKKWHSMFIWRKEKFWLLDDAGKKIFFFFLFCWKCRSHKLNNSTLLLRNWTIFTRNFTLCNAPRSDADINEER